MSGFTNFGGGGAGGGGSGDASNSSCVHGSPGCSGIANFGAGGGGQGGGVVVTRPLQFPQSKNPAGVI